MASRYTFTEYDPAWPAEFEREAARFRAVVGTGVVAIHHIGSTSVPGLAAKPIIDLLPIVRAVGVLDELSVEFAAAGYRVMGEYGLPGRRYFTRDSGDLRTHNLHCYADGDPSIRRHLAFPAYLRTRPDLCREYEEVKRIAYARHLADVQAYNDAKDAWVKRSEAEALAWFDKSAGERG